MINNTPPLLKLFHGHTIFMDIVSGFLGFFNSKVSVKEFEVIIIDSIFQELSSDILYFSEAQNLIIS